MLYLMKHWSLKFIKYVFDLSFPLIDPLITFNIRYGHDKGTTQICKKNLTKNIFFFQIELIFKVMPAE